MCICHRVSDRDITRAVREGCASFDELQDQTRVATACGACHECAHRAFHEQAAAGPCLARTAAASLLAAGA